MKQQAKKSSSTSISTHKSLLGFLHLNRSAQPKIPDAKTSLDKPSKQFEHWFIETSKAVRQGRSSADYWQKLSIFSKEFYVDTFQELEQYGLLRIRS